MGRLKSSAYKQSKRIALAARDGWACKYCRRPLSMLTATLDHVVPLASGGGWANSNLVLACEKCNKRKAAFSIEAFQEIRQMRGWA